MHRVSQRDENYDVSLKRKIRSGGESRGVDKATVASLDVAEAWRVNEWIFRRIRANHGPSRRCP